MDAREQKALVIAATSKIEKRGNETWIVPSQTKGGKYAVTITAEGKACTCPDFELRQEPCKHVMAVQYVLFREQTTEEKPDGTITTTTITPLTITTATTAIRDMAITEVMVATPGTVITSASSAVCSGSCWSSRSRWSCSPGCSP